MEDTRKLQSLEDAYRGNNHGIFYRSIIVAQDGKVDIIRDSDHESPAYQLQGLRPGLWRTFIRHEEGQPHARAFWTVWICDGVSSDLLDQMIGRQEVEDDVKKAAELQTANSEKLDWQVDENIGDPGGDYGIAIRTRHALSSEFYNFLHDTRIQEVEWFTTVQEQWNNLPVTWRQRLEEWYDCSSGSYHMGEDVDGARIGGAIIDCESNGYRPSFAKNSQGEIIGILLGDMFEEGHYDNQEYDVVEHQEALSESASFDVKPVTLNCIHDGDPGIEDKTFNYIATFQITLNRHDLLSNTRQAAADHITEHLLQHQSQYINPYIDLSHMLDGNCNCQTGVDPNLPIITLEADPTLWATLRTSHLDTFSSNTSIKYSLPRMFHVRHAGYHPTVPWYVPVTRSMRVEAAQQQGIVEWTAPTHWHRSLRPTLCTAEEYRLEPVFHYIGCEYAVTPTSTYPPLIAAHIWRWTLHTKDEVLYDPYGAYYQIGRQVKDARELLGHTALFIAPPTKERKKNLHFADIFAIDADRGILFGWLRDKDKGDDVGAFVLPGFSCEDIESSPPYRKIKVESFGFPQVIPTSTKAEEVEYVPVICRQKLTSSSPNPIPEIIIQLPCKEYQKDYHIWQQEILPLIARHLINHRLLHPLFMPYFEKRVNRAMLDLNKERFPLQVIVSNGDYWQAMAKHASRGQAPAEFGFIAEWQLSKAMHPSDWPLLEQLPSLAARLQPKQGAWKALIGTGWHDPIKPTIDPQGQYQRIDVMSYVGCGHVLPPSALYPPDKARFVWSRLSQNSQDSYKIESSIYQMQEQQSNISMLDYLGHTVMIDDYDVVDVIAVDQARGIFFGFDRRISTPDTFLYFQVDKFIPSTAEEQSDSSIPSPPSFLNDPNMKPKHCRNIGLLIQKQDEPSTAPPRFNGGGHSFALGNAYSGPIHTSADVN